MEEFQIDWLIKYQNIALLLMIVIDDVKIYFGLFGGDDSISNIYVGRDRY
jgi:hypothetical protein